MLIFCLLDPQIQFRDPVTQNLIEEGEEHLISLNAELFTQLFLDKYKAYTNGWLDMVESRPDD